MTEPFRFDAGACSVERIGDRQYRLRWRGSRNGERVSVYMFDDPAHLYDGSVRRRCHLNTPVVTSSGHEVLVPNPDPGVRHYFCLEPEQGRPLNLAERRLDLAGTPNFRDLGGYEASDGRRIKWGKLYRSGRLSALTEEDIRYFNGLGVALVCDFRQDIERELEPTQLGDAGTPVFSGLPVALGSSDTFMSNLYNGIIEVYDSAAFMEEINRDFVIRQMPQYAQMFRFLLHGDHPVLIHCASGKDRTGFGAALILDVLGASEETIIGDYLMTNDYLPSNLELDHMSSLFRDARGDEVPDSVLRPLIEVRPEYLHSCFDEIDRRYRSREHFYREALGLDRDDLELLKSHYLEA